jgi:bacterioferritin-associated ferredoxin
MLYFIVKCHILNVEMVIQFNPHQVEKLKNVIMDCEDCIERMEEILRKENSSS